MVDKINFNLTPSTQGINSTSQQNNNVRARQATDPGFEDLLKAQLGRPSTVKFSAHAQRRITSRDINFGRDEATRLEDAVEKAANKGSRESLILMDDLAFVVSVKNKVVITAVDANSRKENVFTNIDSVVLT